jgi:hypothetical protein
VPYRFVKFQIEDANGIMRDVPVSNFGDVGLSYDELETSTIGYKLKKYLRGKGNFNLSFSGVWDNSLVQSASGSGQRPALSGSHTVLEPLVGDKQPRAFGIYIGDKADWQTGETMFGADNSIIVSDYKVDMLTNVYSARIVYAVGGGQPDWSASVIVVVRAFDAGAFDDGAFDAD